MKKFKVVREWIICAEDHADAARIALPHKHYRTKIEEWKNDD